MKIQRLLMLFASAAVLMVGCEKENGTDRPIGSSANIPSQITVNVGQTYSLGSTQSWSSSSEFVASVTGSGVVTGNHVGNCRVSCSAGSCNVTVNATINLFRDPITQWGMSKSDVIAHEGSDYRESGNSIGYNWGSESIASMVMYTFENNKLTSTVLLVKTGYTNEIVDHLMQRYRYLGKVGDEFYFANGDSADNATTSVVMKIYNSSYWQILYMPH